MVKHVVRPVIGACAAFTEERAAVQQAQRAVRAFVATQQRPRWALIEFCDDPWDLLTTIDRTGARQVVVAALGSERAEDALRRLPPSLKTRLQERGVGIVVVDRETEEARKRKARREAELRMESGGRGRCISCGNPSVKGVASRRELGLLKTKFEQTLPEEIVQGVCSRLCLERAMDRATKAEHAATERARRTEERRRTGLYVKITSGGGVESNRRRH